MSEREIITKAEALNRGLKRYYTGNPCPQGHVTDRSSCNGTCLECARIKSKIHAKKNLDRDRKKRSDYNRELCKKLRETNPEWVRKRKEYMKKWRSDPKTKAMEKAYASERKNELREYYTIKENNRRLRKKQNGGEITLEEIQEINKKQNYKCSAPGCKKSTKKEYHIDHRIPVSKGGRNDKSNIDILCPSCNMKKNSKYLHEFAQTRGYLI